MPMYINIYISLIQDYFTQILHKYTLCLSVITVYVNTNIW